LNFSISLTNFMLAVCVLVTPPVMFVSLRTSTTIFLTNILAGFIPSSGAAHFDLATENGLLANLLFAIASCAVVISALDPTALFGPILNVFLSQLFTGLFTVATDPIWTGLFPLGLFASLFSEARCGSEHIGIAILECRLMAGLFTAAANILIANVDL